MKKNSHTLRVGASAITIFFLFGTFPVVPEVPHDTALPTFSLLAATDGTDAVSGASLPEGTDTQTPTTPSGDASKPATPPDATSGATPGGGKLIQPTVLGKGVSLSSHRIAGYAAGGLLGAAGIIGLWRFLDMRTGGHEYRGNDDEDEEDASSGASISVGSAECGDIIHNEWASDQTLRWLHVGLVVSGESLYLYDAATGISMISKGATPTMAGTIHRTAFFVHAGLMVADVITGFLLTSALDRGNHDQVVGLGATHAAIGVAIPLIILGSGIAVDVMMEDNED